MNVRLQQFLAAENISQAQFADSISVARASVSHIVAGRNKPGFDFISSMIKRYPTLNVDWLITGNGKMYKTASDAPVAQVSKLEPSAPTQQVQAAVPSEESFASESDITFAEPDKTFDTPAETKPAERSSDVQDSASTVNIRAISDIITSSKNAEPIKNKRKAVKVMIFFDDGTFQEF